MHLIRSLVFLFPLVTCILSQSRPEPSDVEPSLEHQEQFHELLEALPEESIHAALQENLHPKYKEGVYEHDKAALEAVHSVNAPLATRVLAVAALDLIKRQNVSASASTPSDPTSSNTGAADPPASSTPVIVTVVLSSTDSDGNVVTTTTSAIAEASASVVVGVTTTNAAGSTVVTSSTVPAAIVVSDGVTATTPVSIYSQPAVPTASDGLYDVTTTDSLGNTVVLSSVSSGEVLTTTDARGKTFVTTFTPDGGHVSSLVLLTTTLPDGQKSTITSFAPVSITTNHGAGASGNSNPKLQSGIAVPRMVGGQGLVLVGGAIGAAILL